MLSSQSLQKLIESVQKGSFCSAHGIDTLVSEEDSHKHFSSRDHLPIKKRLQLNVLVVRDIGLANAFPNEDRNIMR
jgi:hypothetical protein